ncbi:MAG TPA: 3-dehydroquinate synthase [Actinomycetes bacterium]|nr:3-dehydroquinate synthase [Actinomycetes bacterium]
MTDNVTIVPVKGEHPYDVLIGSSLLESLPPMLGEGVRRVAVVHPRALAPAGEAVRHHLSESGYQAIAIELPDGEAAKTSEVAAFCWTILGRNTFTRSDAIVAVGGGATTDLAGFVAASWLRGVAVVHMPTTLLGMVDAAVGGKTGINTAEGKNLVGAFHEPAGVICDVETLHTLPVEDLAAGLAEVVKVGFTHDPVILDLLESERVATRAWSSPALRELIARSVAVKANVVSADLRDSGDREFLNYGHTLAHAIERVEQYRWRHGAAVSVGLVYAAELARLAGRLPPEVVARHRAILVGLGLPVAYRRDAWPALYETMQLDKKARGDVLRFVILDDVGRPARLEGPDLTLLTAAYAEVAE